MTDEKYKLAPEPTDDEILDRAQEIFRAAYACWPDCRPSRVAAEAKMAYLEGKLCRLDFYAITTALMMLMATAPKAHANTWPSETPAEFAESLGGLRGEVWPKVVEHVRDSNDTERMH